ncbi:hypothetical protein ACFV2V_19025 [Streptomyces sp. NPDC059698]
MDNPLHNQPPRRAEGQVPEPDRRRPAHHRHPPHDNGMTYTDNRDHHRQQNAQQQHPNHPGRR